ncbi:MAG TPA: hypothetical protein VE572_03680 [Nitrososphaeraceae archaeon]|nr:hypothetical protein [Nitrososphaeraceae archaeon]
MAGISRNKIENVNLSSSRTDLKSNEQVTFRITFGIGGKIRQVFNQKNWEKAYDLHDNLFRIKIVIDLKCGSKKLVHNSSLHKASLFWTRNPKVPYRIWILIIKDDTTFYPSNVEEAQSLLFDIEKEFTVNASHFKVGEQEVHAQIRVWWGKHHYISTCELNSKTNKVLLRKASNV